MKDEVKNAIKTIKTFLGMEIKLEDMKLIDGVTIIQADAFEPNNEVAIVTENGNVPLPIGEYELEDGRMLVIVEEGVIAEIKDAQEEEEMPAEEAPIAEEIPVEASTEAPVKKTVESTVKETFFSKEEMDSKELEIIELKAQIEKLSEVKEVVVELTEEPKPIVHNPENKKPQQLFRYGKAGETTMSRILNKFNN